MKTSPISRRMRTSYLTMKVTRMDRRLCLRSFISRNSSNVVFAKIYQLLPSSNARTASNFTAHLVSKCTKSKLKRTRRKRRRKRLSRMKTKSLPKMAKLLRNLQKKPRKSEDHKRICQRFACAWTRSARTRMNWKLNRWAAYYVTLCARLSSTTEMTRCHTRNWLNFKKKSSKIGRFSRVLLIARMQIANQRCLWASKIWSSIWSTSAQRWHCSAATAMLSTQGKISSQLRSMIAAKIFCPKLKKVRKRLRSTKIKELKTKSWTRREK